MKIPAHRRKKDPFKRQILGVRKPPPPRAPSPADHGIEITDSDEQGPTLNGEEA